MAIVVDFKCDCGEIFEIEKQNMLEYFPETPLCPNCKSANTHRIYSFGGMEIGSGKCGNSKDGYSSSMGGYGGTQSTNLRKMRVK